MEARGADQPAPTLAARARVSLLGLFPLALIGAAVAFFWALGAPGLGERRGPPVERVAIERAVLRPGQIELTVRNDGPDAVEVAQVAINDAYADFRASARRIGRLAAEKLTIAYPWVDGEAYEVVLLTSSGATIAHEIPVAVETPSNDSGFYGLMALLGAYVGVVPIAFGMLWLPFLRRLRDEWVRMLMALTVGLLVFLGVEAAIEAVETASQGAEALGGLSLVFLGAMAAYLVLAAVSTRMRARRQARAAEAGGAYVALMVAVGIGLHNLGEGLAIGTAYAVGSLALGALLVIGFALHNTTEGLAIVAPLAGRRASPGRLAGLGLIAGAPAIVGAWIGAGAGTPSIAAFLLGAGVGAIAQVSQQLAPLLRDREGRYFHPGSVAGLLLGFAALYATGLLIPV